MNLKTTPVSVLKKLFAVISVLLCANILAVLLKLNFDGFLAKAFTDVFDFNKEANIPALYSSLTLLACSALLFFIYLMVRKENSFGSRWLILSMVFLFLSMDELGSIHERIGPYLNTSYKLSGLQYFFWIVPYGIVVLILTVLYFPFFLKLPNRIKMLFISSGLIYISGAVGLEILGENHYHSFGAYNYFYALYYTFEELLEMAGIAIFMYSLLVYIADFTDVSKIGIELKSSDKTVNSKYSGIKRKAAKPSKILQ